jgi:predicted TIM-barrel enzyme
MKGTEKMRQFTRKEINENLRNRIAKKEPIILGGAGIGLVAKIADRAGIDIIMAYNTGPFRMDGNPSCTGYLAYGDSNGITLQLGYQILNKVDNTPVIAGIGAADPYRNITKLIDEMIDMGFSGITNVPTAGAYDGKFAEEINDAGVGYPEEIKLIAKCNKKDVFTVAYAYNVDQVKAMVEAGVDIVSPHVGGTSGGTVGVKKVIGIEEACEKTQKLYEAAISANPNVIVVCHGGPFESPKEVKTCFERTDIHGFIGASSIERLPVERAITEVIHEFKSLRLR